MAVRLTERVYYLPHNHDTDRPAIGIILGDSAVMLIDGGNSPAHARDIMKAVGELTERPIKYIGLTHWHWDHSFGLSAYESAAVIAHPDCDKELRRMQSLKWDDESIDERIRRGEEIPFCAENIRKEFKNRDDIKIRTADILTEGRLSINLGGVSVNCFYIGGEHSRDSMGYFVNGENILFLGDALCHNMFTGPWSYDLEDFKRRLKSFDALPAEYFVNGHWAPQNKNEFKAFCDNMLSLGAVAGDFTVFSDAMDKYKADKGKEPEPESADLLRSFVEGNIKRLNSKLKPQPVNKAVNHA